MGDMAPALLDKVLDEALAVPGRSFRLHGIGEPLLSPLFPHAVERIKTDPRDHHIELVTNAHLLNRGGQAMSELQIGPSASPDIQQIDLPLAGFAAGEYILEIKAGDLKELVGFRVTS